MSFLKRMLVRLQSRFFEHEKREGFIPFPEGNVWFCLEGKSVRKGGGIPLVVLHGGPGFPHDYLESLKPLMAERQVLFYDQAGCGLSYRPNDVSSFTIPFFLHELENILRFLDIQEYVLLGHSWGAMLALDHALLRPQGLLGLVLASPIVKTLDWSRDINRFREDLSHAQRQAIETAEQEDGYEAPAFLEATRAFYAKHVLRLFPWPEMYARAGQKIGNEVYRHMWGPTEFICSGTLRSYDRVDRLFEVDVPTLFTCGVYEGARPETLAEYVLQMPHSSLSVFEESSHMPHLEEQEKYLGVLREFLEALDDKKEKSSA